MAETLHQLLQKTQKLHNEASEQRNFKGLEQALEQYNQLLNMAPDEAHLVFLVGTVNLQLGNNGTAINMMMRAQQLAPKPLPEIWNNMGSAYKAEHMDKDAEHCFLKALELNEVTDYYNNLSTLHINSGTPEKGLPFSRKALELDEMNVKAHWNLSLVLLELGQWSEGFAEYDAGILTHDRMDRHYDNKQSIPYWQGQDLTDKTIVVYGEQGLGDEIMFASALPDLIATGARVIYECHERLETVMRRSFPECEIYPTRKSDYIDWPKNRKIDYRCAIGTLFRWFRSDGQFPRKQYLKVDEAKVSHYRSMIEQLGDGPYIGIGYSGGHKKTHGHARSLQLTPLKPILEQDCTFVSLQYSDGAGDKFERFHNDTGIRVHHFPEATEAWESEGVKNPGWDYDEALSLMAAMDFCILPNTTAVHACGALGQSVWTLTPDACAWRYAQGGPRMVMYGNWVTQYRENGDWGKAINSMAKHLEMRISDGH